MVMVKKEKLALIDGHSVLFRAYYAYPPLTTKEGELVNAVYGFTNILLSVIRDLEPTHIAVSFDRSKPTFRHEEYKGYKANRAETPMELKDQQGRVEEVVRILNIPIFALDGFEADDVIGTLTEQAIGKKQDGLEVVIVTGDQDAFQLLDEDGVLVYTPGRKNSQPKLWNAEAVKEKYGLIPAQIIDYKSLAGDSSDAIPGVKGIGPKMATKLLQTYTTREGIYNNLEEVKNKFGNSVFNKLKQGEKLSELSYRLATIDRQAPIKLSLPECEIHDYDKSKAVALFEALDFKSLINKLPNDLFEQMVEEEIF